MGDKGLTGRVAGHQLCAPMIGVFLTLGLVGCKGLDTQDDLSVGASFSALPNLGLAVAAAQVFKSDDARTWAFEIEATHQPWDDEALARDGNPAAARSAWRAVIELQPDHSGANQALRRVDPR